MSPYNRKTLRDLKLKLAFCAASLAVAVSTAHAAPPGDAAKVARLSLEVQRTEDLRAVKRLQISYAQYSQFGLWSEMASLFADDAEAIYGDDDTKGRAAIAKFYLTRWGGGREGLPPGGLHTQFDETPVINLSADGKTAKGRWHEFSMLGQYGGGASWAHGVMENDYVKEKGVWKIARLHYYPVFAGPYETGWRNAGADLPFIAYHFTPVEAGVPVPAIPADMPIPRVKGSPTAALAAIRKRIAAMNDEDKVRNLQNAYGYYIDRKMWDDATDLFTDDGVLEVTDVGVYSGAKSIRHAFDRHGPQGLLRGENNDRPMFDMVVTVSPDGAQARSRGIEFSETGDMKTGAASLGLDVYENRYVKGADGIWRIREMRVFPIMATDYYQGWAKSRLVTPPVAGEYAPDAPTPAADVMGDGAIPVFFQNNPVTGKPVALPGGAKVTGDDSLLPALAASGPLVEAPADMDAAIAEAERRLAISKAYDGVDNISHAFGNYIDDFKWKDESLLYAKDGWRGKYLVGFYIGPDHIEKCERYELGDTPNPRLQMDIHWLVQPVINVSDDGKSATLRARLFHLNSSDKRSGVLSNGMYPNDAAVLEDGVWKFEAVAIDEPYFNSSSYADGWSHYKGRPETPIPGGPGNAKPPALMLKLIKQLPPDVPLSSMPVRYHGFMPGDIVDWPQIKPMWFSYKNPVSGRIPPFYCPDLKTCEKELEANY